MTATLPTLQPSAAASFAYWGERAGWRIAASQHRDSDALERSNYRTITSDILPAYPEDAAVESMSHWAVGWVEYLLVRPGSPAADAAQRWSDRLADYPVADEDDYSALEWTEEWCVRCDRGTREDHPLHGCRFRGESDRDDIGYRWDHRRSPDGRAERLARWDAARLARGQSPLPLVY